MASKIQNSDSLNEIPNYFSLIYLSDCVFSFCAFFIPIPLSPDVNLADDLHLGCAPPFLNFLTFPCSLFVFCHLVFVPVLPFSGYPSPCALWGAPLELPLFWNPNVESCAAGHILVISKKLLLQFQIKICYNHSCVN